jgi:hypothetical protein
MPWTTVAVVFGSWILILALTLFRFLATSRHRDENDTEGGP